MNRPEIISHIFDLFHDYEEWSKFCYKSGSLTIKDNDMYKIYVYICFLEDRINKAVEFLNLYAGYDNNYCLDYHEIGKLVEILKGDSNDKI